MKHRTTEVQIIPIKPKDGLIAFASVVVDNVLFLGSIGVHSKLEGGFRLTYPTKLVSNRNVHIYHPIDRQLSKDIEAAIFQKLKEVMNKCNDRYNCFEFA
mgnify:CR=1 FL=1